MPVVLTDGVEKRIHAADQDQGRLNQQDAREQLELRISQMQVEHVPIADLKPNPRNAKKHPEKQIALLADNYRQFGFTQPVLIDELDVLIAGHARWQAALRVGLSHVPSIRLSGLSSAAKRAVAIADNKLAELGEWNFDVLPEEIKLLFDTETDLSFDPHIMGFETPELDQILQDDRDDRRADPADQTDQPDPTAAATTAEGDLWQCGSNTLLCGSAVEPENYQTLLGQERAALAFVDGPYNVPHAGHVTHRPDVRELAAGEMSSEAITACCRTFCENLLPYLLAGAVVYLCSEWRHLFEVRTAADAVFGDLKNLVVWVKTNAGMGSFYRSQHEMILVYVVPGERPTKNFGLGGKGRHRSDVWKYPGFDAFGRETLAMQPSVKPVALVADALLDCSKRRDIVLDPFGGSGTTMIAAERTGRCARLMEIDPLRCDLIVQRWQKFSGKTARLVETNETFDEVAVRRATATRRI
jgi:hypothetical protein